MPNFAVKLRLIMRVSPVSDISPSQLRIAGLWGMLCGVARSGLKCVCLENQGYRSASCSDPNFRGSMATRCLSYTLACDARCDRAANPWCQIQRRKDTRSRRSEFRLSKSDRCCLSASNTFSTVCSKYGIMLRSWAATMSCHNIILSLHTNSELNWLVIDLFR